MNFLIIFLTSLRLGLTSFGGPIAHLGYFHQEYVKKKKWISEEVYADLVALCQFLPGPASSQVGIGIGFMRGGVFGAFLSWLGFTLPSAIILILFGLGLTSVNLDHHQHWLHGLKVVAVSVVAQAVFGMWKKLCPDLIRSLLALGAAAILFLVNSVLIQILVLIASGIFGAYFFKSNKILKGMPEKKEKKNLGFIFLSAFFVLLIILPLIASTTNLQILKLIDSFYRAGAIVFGGGHVVLPILEAEVVNSGWISKDLFMAGYGISNAIPGPLFTFSAYIGSVSSISPNGWAGGLISLLSIFLPSFLLIIGVLPYWDQMRKLPRMQEALMGLNAAVVGILLAALYDPVWTSAIFSVRDFILAAVGFLLLEFGKVPAWTVVLLSVIISFII